MMNDNKEVKNEIPCTDRLSFLRTYALFILFVLAGGIFMSFIFNLASKPAKLTQAVELARPEKEIITKNMIIPVKENIQPAAPVLKPVEPEEVIRTPSFILNGTFFSGGQGYALINQHIVKEGDLVGKATVQRVALNEVELEFSGSIIKLSMKR